MSIVNHLAVLQRRRSGGGTPWTQVLGVSGGSGYSVGHNAAVTYAYFSFTAANSGEVDSITLHLREDGTDDSGTDTLDIMLYTDDGSGEPDTLVADSTISGISYNDLPNADADHAFTYSGSKPSITSSVRYHIVLKANQIDATDFVTVKYDPTDTERVGRGSAVPAWTPQDTSAIVEGQISGTT